jgi:hypothetical protein
MAAAQGKFVTASRRRRLARSLVVPLKSAVLVLVFFRFHGSWIGATVALAMAFLLFGVDRLLLRLAGRALGASK